MDARGAATPQGSLKRGMQGRGPTSALSAVVALVLLCQRGLACSITRGSGRARKADTTTTTRTRGFHAALQEQTACDTEVRARGGQEGVRSPGRHCRGTRPGRSREDLRPSSQDCAAQAGPCRTSGYLRGQPRGTCENLVPEDFHSRRKPGRYDPREYVVRSGRVITTVLFLSPSENEWMDLKFSNPVT